MFLLRILLGLLVSQINFVAGQYDYEYYDYGSSGGCQPALGVPANGRLTSNCDNIQGSTCSFACNPGYVMRGSSRVTCNNGVWSSQVPVCIPSSGTASNARCPRLDNPANGYIEGVCGPGASAGDRCVYRCYSPFQIRGAGTLVCLTGGVWSQNPPNCVYPGFQAISSQYCSSLVAPGNGAMTGQCSPGIFGSSCAFSCNSGYSLIGSKLLTCGANGLWSSNPPTCSAIIGFIKVPIRYGYRGKK